MGDVIHAEGLFRDRRDVRTTTVSGAMDPQRMTNKELHAHLHDAHKWGGPKSAPKSRLLSAHTNSHDDPVGVEIPHSHGA